MQDLGSMNLAADHMLDIRCRQDVEGAFGMSAKWEPRGLHGQTLKCFTVSGSFDNVYLVRRMYPCPSVFCS